MKKRPHKTPPVSVQPPLPWYKKVWVVATAVGAAAFAIGLNGPTILQNARIMPAEISATSDLYLSWLKEDDKWTGNWSNYPEGIVNMADMNLSDGIDLKMSIVSNNGNIGGEISTGAICKNVPHVDFLMIRGKVSGLTARVTVWDIIGGKTFTFAELDLVRKNNVITVKAVSGNSDWFPSGARIGKHPYSDEQLLTNFCNRTPVQPLDRVRRHIE